MTIRWLRAAAVSLRHIHGHISVENPTAARRVVRAIRSATDRLGQFPASGRPGTVAGTREVVVPGLPYVVVYRAIGTDVEILRVFHTSTDWYRGPL